MSKRLILALLLVALSTVALLMNNTDSVSLNLFTYSLSTNLAFALLGAEVMGVIVGLLLK